MLNMTAARRQSTWHSKRLWCAHAQVRIFSNNPQGAISVRFKLPEPAQQCVQKMKGRFFGGRQVDAFMWDGITNYQVKKKVAETPEEQQKRLEAFAASIEGGS